MHDYIRERVFKIAAYIVEYRCTVREAASVFNVSKSTVHKDVAERLPRLDSILAKEVRKILNANKAERHLRGGEATRKKYKQAESN
ncbi:MAG: putative DeoR family transcriptional regulator, stage sporulation protein [Clostridia bacterium]|nr:putative DeoR family transcriptional regulator, stage sporulation protein [Clostridia bacterium]